MQASPQQKLNRQMVKIKAEIDFNEQVIEERQQVFDKAEQIMNNINDIAGQLQTNTKEQGVELIQADIAVETALSNTVKANEEILEAQVIQK
jgi:hypothetical protein